MSTNKTQNYNLHSWVPDDDFLRAEFNDNFTALDAALKSEVNALTAKINTDIATLDAAGKSQLNAKIAQLKAALTAEGKWVVGTYVGDDTNDREFDLGGPILAVLVENIIGFRGSTDTSRNYGGLCLPGFALRNNSLRVAGNSFFVSSKKNTSTASNSTNYLDNTLFYIALVQLP